MSIDIPKALAQASTYEPLSSKVRNYGDDVSLEPRDLTDEMLAEVSRLAHEAKNGSVARVFDSIIKARTGDTDQVIPRLTAAPELIIEHLRKHLSDGWVYERNEDGHLSAWLVTKVEFHTPQGQGSPSVSINLAANGRSERGNKATSLKIGSKTLFADSTTKKRVSRVLMDQGLLIETPELREEYDKGHAYYVNILSTGFAEQYRYNGLPSKDKWSDKGGRREGHKVVHDLAPNEISAPSDFTSSILFEPVGESGQRIVMSAQKRKKMIEEGDEIDFGVGALPTHFDLRVFDLHTHDFIWVNTSDLVRYEYDPTLIEKIVLPEDQRNLLDILTSGLDNFTGDVIEGKSAGNVILCKGRPGVGKTLTAEVYSEMIERPLYSIHSGNLGINAKDVRENLEITFQRAKRWNAVLLLDEADVFVLERGTNISQNAIVAEFLRTLEYFTGLMFMTTNRADNIDDAILSRAAAIIDYKLPGTVGIREVWKVQGRNQNVEINDDLLDELVYGFKEIAPRDIKMLLRLALRVSAGTNVPLSSDVFASCAMFRGLHFEPNSREEDEAPAPRRIRKRVQS